MECKKTSAHFKLIIIFIFNIIKIYHYNILFFYIKDIFILCGTIIRGQMSMDVVVAEGSNNNNYFSNYVPLSVQVDLKAGAFVSLRDHLQQRSSEVSNIDMMSISGFCRNCLAKWLVISARKLSTKLKIDLQSTTKSSNNSNDVDQLDSFGYDEAAEYIYGCKYVEWKTRYQTKATEAQL
jgi:hypothetical protein